MDKIKVAFFDAKDYDIESFNRSNNNEQVEIRFFEARLTEDTANLADGYDVVCVFVNDVVGEKVFSLCGCRTCDGTFVDISKTYS